MATQHTAPARAYTARAAAPAARAARSFVAPANIQRSAKNAGRILGYSNFWYVSTANDCIRHGQLEKTGTFDPFTDREIHYY